MAQLGLSAAETKKKKKKKNFERSQDQAETASARTLHSCTVKTEGVAKYDWAILGNW